FVSGSAPRWPMRMTLLTPRAMRASGTDWTWAWGSRVERHWRSAGGPRRAGILCASPPGCISNRCGNPEKRRRARRDPERGGFCTELDPARIVLGWHFSSRFPMSFIRIRGARTHNLKNLDIDLPRDRLIVFTGLSGSGKSSLAFDTIYAEGQRRYVESLSAYARQFLSMMEKPDVDTIEGLSPAIAIEQKSASHNPRSTVGTVTEIYDYLRLLYARAGIPRCPDHGQGLAAQTVSQMVDQVLRIAPGTALLLLAPVV